MTAHPLSPRALPKESGPLPRTARRDGPLRGLYRPVPVRSALHRPIALILSHLTIPS